MGWLEKQQKKFHRNLVRVQRYSNFPLYHFLLQNQGTHEIAVFSELKTFFSMGGEVFTSNPVTYSPLADETFEDPHNISTKLHHRVGGFVNIHLRFSSNWILISNVDFDISPVLLLGWWVDRTEKRKPQDIATSNSNMVYINLYEYSKDSPLNNHIVLTMRGTMIFVT